MTSDIFCQKVCEHFCIARLICKPNHEFLSLENGSMTVAKYTTIFSKKKHFSREHCTTKATWFEHYVEGLPFEYRDMVRQQKALATAMDEALKVEDGLYVQCYTSLRFSMKRKWEGPSDHSKNKKIFVEKNSDKPKFCGTSRSIHKVPCYRSNMICR